MIPPEPLLVILVTLVNRIRMPPPPSKRKRGHPYVYPDRLFLQALVIMIVRRLHKPHELLAALGENKGEMQPLRRLLTENGRYPARRTWERRLKAIPDTLPAQIGCLGRDVVNVIQPWQSSGRAGAIDSTVLRANGGVWHKKDCEQGIVPHTSIDTEAAWTQSGWHGWVYGWNLHLISAVATVWISLAALLTPANTADNEAAPALMCAVPPEMRFLLGDRHYNAPNVRQAWETIEGVLVVSQPVWSLSAYRRWRRRAPCVPQNTCTHHRELRAFQGHLWSRSSPDERIAQHATVALDAVFVDQLALLYRFENQLPLCIGLKAFLSGLSIYDHASTNSPSNA